MACKGLCGRIPGARHYKRGAPKYGPGRSRCSTCSMNMSHDGPRCPCCGHLLRHAPRPNARRRAALQEERGVRRI